MILKVLLILVLTGAVAWFLYSAVKLIIELRAPAEPATAYWRKRYVLTTAVSGALIVLAALGVRWASERHRRLKSAGRA